MSGSVPTVSTVGCRMIEFPVARDQRGNLTVIEGTRLPFEIARVFYIDAVPGGANRAGQSGSDGTSSGGGTGVPKRSIPCSTRFIAVCSTWIRAWRFCSPEMMSHGARW